MTDKEIKNLAEEILQEYTNCYSEVDKDCLVKMLRKHIPEGSVVLTMNDHVKVVEKVRQEFEAEYKDKVVLTREEYEALKFTKTVLELREEKIKYLEDANIRYAEALELKVNEKERKETAREILVELIGHTFECEGWSYRVDVEDVKWLADKYGIEIGEVE